MQGLGQLSIPRINIEPFPFPTSSDYQSRLLQQYFPITDRTEAGKKLLESLGRDPRVMALDGAMVPCGIGRQVFGVKMLAMWALWYANEFGSDRAQICLNSFLDAESISISKVLWVLGVGAPNSITMLGEYTVRPIDDMPDSSLTERFKQSASSVFPSRPPALRCAITKSCQVKKATNPDAPVEQSEAQRFREIDARMEEIAWLLNALDGICCIPFITTGHVEPSIPFGPFGGLGAVGRTLDVQGMAVTMLATESDAAIKDLLNNYDRLDGAEKSRIQRILKRLSQAKKGADIEDKILDLGIATEMLLLQDNTSREQLALAFRLRGSWLLGSSPGERKEIYNHLKEVYRYRSEVAHSGVLHKGDRAKVNVVSRQFPKYQSLAERTVRKIMKDGRPDWDSLITGGA